MASIDPADAPVLGDHPSEEGEAVLLPVVAIVGRPNVGKSTLFNRLVGERRAIVADEPGTTRDRVMSRVTGDLGPYILVDTGGLDSTAGEPITAKVHDQVQTALDEADVVVFLTDGSTGPQPGDSEVADLLRRRGKPIVLAVAKCEGETRHLALSEFYSLGLGDPLPISALKSEGIADLMDQVVIHFPPTEEQETPTDFPRLALVGRPNVGKSSLLNAITGEERAIVHETPGTTRDAIDSWASYLDQPLVLIDTAGIRRRGRIEPGIERFSALRALQAIERSNVAVLVVDAEELMTAQDAHIAGYVAEAYRGMVVAVNKWDLAPAMGMRMSDAMKEVRRRLHWAPYVPIRLVSAATGEGVADLLETALNVFRERGKVVDAGELSRVLMEALGKHAPPTHGRRSLRFLRVAQTGTHPPSFTFYVNHPEMVHFSYRRYLQNTLRSAFGFEGSLLRLHFQKVSRRGPR